VVADEVRKLAERSSVSAKEIMSLVSRSTAIVDLEVAIVTETGKRLSKLVEEIQSVSARFQDVAAAVVDERSIVDQLSNISKENFISSQEIGAATEQLSTQAQEMATSIRKL
jgi:methyl-accepting chemotaxis protein